LFSFFGVIPRRLNFVCRRFGTLCFLLYAFFWVKPGRLKFMCRRFGTVFHLHRQVDVSRMNYDVFIIPTSFYAHLPAYEDGTDRVFRNVGIQTSDVGVLPKRKHATYRTRRKLEIRNSVSSIFTSGLSWKNNREPSQTKPKCELKAEVYAKHKSTSFCLLAIPAFDSIAGLYNRHLNWGICLR